MKTGTSLYLDGVRFAAALTVFLEHIRQHTKIGFRWFWQDHPSLYRYLNPWSMTAVAVFFVLSGYVIAHVLATRERDALTYAASRFGRLYSVVVPALLLTALCNYLITLRFPTAFQGFEAAGPAWVAWCWTGTALFVNRFWLWPDLDPPNTAFWSMSFEAFYYVLIALLLFLRGPGRILSVVVLCLLAGPSMVLLAPVWLVGFGTYHLGRRWGLGVWPGLLLWLVTLLLLPACAWIELQLPGRLEWLRTTHRSWGLLAASYAAGLCFALNVLAFDAISRPAERVLLPLAPLLRWLGSITFALYLFHPPLVSLFTVYHLPDRSSVGQFALLFGGTLLIAGTVGRFCESMKRPLRDWFLAAAGSLRRGPPPVALAPAGAALPVSARAHHQQEE